jgi:anaerobic selenocysteine-containing dehydrogenase
MSVVTKRSFCRFCHAGCAIDVDVDTVANAVLQVRGVQEDPMYEGYTCVKGRHLGFQHEHPGRLRQSMKKTANGHEPIDTNLAFDEIAERLAGILAKHGPRSVATYCGTAAYQNATGLPIAAAFHASIGSPSFYTSSSIDQPGKAVAPLRHGAWAAGVHAIDTADVAMVIGCNTLVSTFGYPGGLPGFNPLVRLRRAKEAGLSLIVIDPRFTEVAHYADLYLPVKPGEDTTLLSAFIREILEHDLHDKEFCAQYVNGLDELRIAVDPYTVDYASRRTGVDAGLIVEAARRFAAGPRGAVSTGTGPDMAPHSSLMEHLVLVMNTLCGRYNRAGEMVQNPGGLMTPPGPLRAQVIPPKPETLTKGPKTRIRNLHNQRGQAPTSTLAEEILLEGEGQVRALFTLGGNPVVAWPDQLTTVRALQNLDLHVLMDVHMSPSAQLADYVIASTLSLERPDVPTTIDRWFDQPYQHYTPAVLEMRGDIRQEWQVYTEVAARLGVTIKMAGGDITPGMAVTADDVLDLIYANSKLPLSELRKHVGGALFPEYVTTVQPAEEGANARLEMVPEGIAEEMAEVFAETTSASVIKGFDPAVHTFRMSTRRLKSVFNSSGREVEKLREREGTNFAHLNSADLAELGVKDGDIVEVASPKGAIKAVVKAADDVSRGTVSMAHAWGGLPDTPSDLGIVGSTTGALIDLESGYDAITGIPVMSAIPVAIRPAPVG